MTAPAEGMLARLSGVTASATGWPIEPSGIAATYDYHDASGKLLHQTVRYEPKRFSQRRPDPNRPGEWINNLEGVDCVLYRLPELLHEKAKGLEIFLPEGEKDVLALVEHGLAATCNPMGARKWKDGYTETLKGADVIIIADKDKDGRDHAQLAAGRLHEAARRVRVLELPDLEGKPVKDTYDFFAAGGTAEQLKELCAKAQDWAASAKAAGSAVGEQSATPGSKPAHAELQEAYGSPFYINANGRVTSINERYWAGLYALENRVLYDPDEKLFYRYNETRGLWRTITAETIRETISQRMLEVSRELDEFSLETRITLTKLKAVVEVLKGITEKRDVFRSKQPFIHVANGVIRFAEDGDVRFGGFSPEDYSRNQSPYTFDAAAECPRFLNELILPALSAEDADLLQRWAGLALFGYNLPQRFLILDGTPNGGKSTFVRVIQALVGPENCYQLRTECLTERFETYRYRGKTLLIGPDVAGDFLMQRGASMLKVLVGGDPISAEGKGLNGDFAMLGTFNIIMTCNSRLRIRLEGDAGAWRRRLLVVRFENPPPAKRILDFDRVLLKEEGAGVLRWAMAGFVKLQQEFAHCGDFALSEAQRGRIDSLLAESDSLRLFARERIERHEGGDITNAEFQQAYAEYCADKGWNSMPVTVVERQAADVMLDLYSAPKGHSIEREGKSQRGWRNVRLLEVREAVWR